MTRAHIEGLLAVLVLGTVPVTIKAVGANPWTIGFARLALATLCVTLFLKGGRGFFSRTAGEKKALFLIGFIFSIHWATYFVSIKMTDASAAAIGAATYGVHVSILGRIFLRQAPTKLQWASLLIAFGGAVLVVDDFSLDSAVTAGFYLSVFSGFLYALLPILHQRNSDIPINLRTFSQYAFALPLFILLLPKTDWNLEAVDWWRLLHLGVIATFIAHSLWIRCASTLPTFVSGMIYYLYVPSAMLLSAWLLKEDIQPSRILGATLIVAASCLGIFTQPKTSTEPADHD